MPGLNASLYIGLSGMQAQQAALGVVGHNIANVNTPGYTRQRADMSANQSMMQGNVYFGSGVSLNTVTGIRDRFLDLQIYRETAKGAGASERYSGVDAIASSVGDTGTTGISAQIQDFFQSFQSLAAHPEDPSLRTNVVGKAQTMVTGLQSRYSLLDAQRNIADQAVGSLVTAVNTLTSQIANLNQQITTETVPGSNNDARDQRKALTDKLAELVGINVFEGSKGEYQITLDTGAAVLVSGGRSYNLQTTPGGAALDNHLRVNSVMGGSLVDVTAGIKDGQLGAKLDLRDNILVGFQRQLDQIAAGVARQVNQLHRTGYAADGVTTGNDFFQGGVANGGTGLPTTVSAATFYKGMVNALSVNAAIVGNPSLIAAASAAGVKGDNSRANAIGNLQAATATVDTNGDGVPDAGPFSNVVGSLISDVGTQSQTYRAQTDTQQNLVSALQTQRDSVSGVDLNEEAANMMNLQRGYQASARFLSVINQLTDQLVNQFGK
ncbi:flagellar hook-associated protein FlgK [Geothrix sp. PMB-07]|uniref:flagellar hook-associated protein FlgK n=1 Tax=Geothrix sp. PMB-07 TaxID=3068640 RepID=UPI002741FCC2|nr:flagellar hook-associated protein FlgK [Geothrix sp. PMB-07]WLT32927.1 flagellar hook-associated protein FlgK [Geothrix sp. PMB-07]